jgi:hypothetical protein
MLYDELQQEVERRASSPEGMVALFHAILKDFADAIQSSSSQNPEERLYFLLRQYVKFKRLYCYFLKDARHRRYNAGTVTFREKDAYYVGIIENFREQLRDVYARIPTDRLAVLKKTIGANISFGAIN